MRRPSGQLRLVVAAFGDPGHAFPAIAYGSGFAHQSHFTRAFKRHTGLTPARYRESTRR